MRSVATGAAALMLLAAAGCGLADKEAPPLAGPSSFALSVSLVATPDRMIQDGVSKATVTAFVRDVSNQPVRDLPIQWSVAASDGRTFVEPSWRTSPTDSGGQTTVEITAPAAPEALPLTPLTLTVTATPLGTDSANAVSRQVTIALQPPMGTLPVNNLPMPAFTVSPSTAMIRQTITVDASQTRDEGVLCLDVCRYSWDFGDGQTKTGRVDTHSYQSIGTYTITLTVTDGRSGVATATRSILITEPTPIAGELGFSPTAPRTGQLINFDAGSFTVGVGATIEDYTWVWGDGTSELTRSAQAQHSYVVTPIPPELTGTATFVVRVTARDSLGRTHTATVNVTVTSP
jgi:PKD repeat protein